MRAICALLWVIVAGSLAFAQTPAVEFGSQRYIKKKEMALRADEISVEFGLEKEPLAAWTRLLTFHWLPNADIKPASAAGTMGKFIEGHAEVLGSRVLDHPKTGEAMLDILYATPKSEVVEFNIYKYALSGTGRGLVAARYAFRFNLGERESTEVRKLKSRAVAQMGKFDMAAVRSYFDKPR